MLSVSPCCTASGLMRASVFSTCAPISVRDPRQLSHPSNALSSAESVGVRRCGVVRPRNRDTLLHYRQKAHGYVVWSSDVDTSRSTGNRV
jgi:hypothetical protein